MGVSKQNTKLPYTCIRVVADQRADAIKAHMLIDGYDILCSGRQDVLSNTCMYANRHRAQTNADLCIDGKNRLFHDISYTQSYILPYMCMVVIWGVHRFLTIGRDARKLSLVRLH